MSAVQMLNLEDMPQEQLMAVAQDMLVNKKRSERVIYYRNPTVTQDGRPHHEPGWIHWGDSQEQKQVWEWAKGRLPLNRFGAIEAKKNDDAPDGPFEKYGPWGPILCHPEGPKEFPVDQILTFGWYDPKRCPVPGVRFPQLREWIAEGNEITEYACPECNSVAYREARFLGRHLKNTHGWDRLEIIAFGKEVGFDLSRDFSGRGKITRTYGYDESESMAPSLAPEAEEEIAVKTVTARRREERSPEEIAEAKRRMELVRQHRKPHRVR